MPLYQPKGRVLRIGDAFLHQDNPIAADVLLDEDVRAGDHEVVWAASSLVVDGEIRSAQVIMAACGKLGADDREFQQPQSPHRLLHAVAIERRECLLVSGQVARDLMHLRRLIHRSANEQNALFLAHVPSSQRVLNAPTTNTTAANAEITPTERKVAALSTNTMEERSASFT